MERSSRVSTVAYRETEGERDGRRQVGQARVQCSSVARRETGEIAVNASTVGVTVLKHAIRLTGHQS